MKNDIFFEVGHFLIIIIIILGLQILSRCVIVWYTRRISMFNFILLKKNIYIWTYYWGRYCAVLGRSGGYRSPAVCEPASIAGPIGAPPGEQRATKNVAWTARSARAAIHTLRPIIYLPSINMKLYKLYVVFRLCKQTGVKACENG